MRVIIDDRIYDTKTAREVCSRMSSGSPDGTEREEVLYRTRRGLYFVHSVDRRKQDAETISPVTGREAMEFAEGKLELPEYLAAFPNDSPDDVVSVMVPLTRSTRQRLKAAAKECGATMGSLLAGIVSDWLDGR